MCTNEKLAEIHQNAHREIQHLLNAMSARIMELGDTELDTLMQELRNAWAKHFLLNDIAAWQRSGDGQDTVAGAASADDVPG